MQQAKLPLFIKHAISISIVGLNLGVTSMFQKLILLYHYCLHTLSMSQQRFANRTSELLACIIVLYLHLIYTTKNRSNTTTTIFIVVYSLFISVSKH